MPLFPSDFKKFKHVSHDDKTVTLQHPKGHQIIIARHAVKGDLSKQLDAMCSGGMVKEAEGGIIASVRRSGYAGSGAKATQDVRDADSDAKADAAGASRHTESTTDVRTPEQKAAAVEQAKKYGYAEGGIIDPGLPKKPKKEDPRVASIDMHKRSYAEGGDVKPKEPNVMDSALQRTREIYNNLISPPPSQFASAKGGIPDDPTQGTVFKGDETPQHVDPNVAAQAQKMQADEAAQSAAQSAEAQQKVIAENQARTGLGMQPLDVPNVPQNGPPMPQQDAGIAQGMPQPGQAAAPVKSDPNDPQNMLQSGMNSRMAGIQQQAQAQGQMGQEQQAALAKNQEIQQKAQNSYKEHYDLLDSERQALVKDIQDGHIDPAKYWNDHSKIASGIGMILAGFNPTNAPNAAIGFLKHQMDMNLESQRANLASKQNLLSANMQQFGNLKDAMQMTRIMQNDIMQNELQQAAAKATSPLAKAAAMQAAGQLKMEAAPMFQQFALRRAMMNMAGGQNNNDPSDTSVQEHQIAMMRVLNPEMAKEMEGRLVPGIGMAKIPVPADVREKLTQHQDMDVAIKDLQHFVNNHTTIIPGTADYNTGAQKALLVQSAVREGKLGTVYREGEQPLLDKFVSSNPANAMKMLNTVPQLKELLGSNERSTNVLKKQYGLPVSIHTPGADQNAQASAWVQANINSKDPATKAKAEQIKQHLGQ